MRIGIGLPAAVPGTDMTSLGQWAADGERAGFAAVGVIDRLVYDNLEPLTALAAAAARTERVELITTVLNVGWRNNAVLLAKQIASVERISGGRLTAGLGLGGWPEDYTASQAPQTGKAAVWESSLATMRQVWAGKMSGQGGPMPELPDGRPALLFGGLVPAAHKRAATQGQGWVAPLFGLSILQAGGRSRAASMERGGTIRATTDSDRALLWPRRERRCHCRRIHPPLLRRRILAHRPRRHPDHLRTSRRGAAGTAGGRRYRRGPLPDLGWARTGRPTGRSSPERRIPPGTFTRQ